MGLYCDMAIPIKYKIIIDEGIREMNDIYSAFRSGKCIMQELEWMNLKCKDCGADMPKYPYYDTNGNEIKICEKCGRKEILIRDFKRLKQ